MTAKSEAWEDDLLVILFQNTAQGLVSAMNITAGSATTLYMALSTGTLVDVSTQVTTEASYGTYARVGLLRSGGNWPKALNNSVQNGAAITFSERTDVGTDLVTDVSIGENTSGAGENFYYGALDSSLSVTQNVQPEFAINALDIEEN